MSASVYQPSHIGDYFRPSRSKKQKVSLKHLQTYIDLHHSHHDGITEDTVAKELSYELVCNEDFVGCYIKWLADSATYLNDKKELLAHSSSLGYASSFSEFFLNKYCDYPVPPPLMKEKWTKKITLITTIEADYCFKEHTKMSQEKETATTEDIQSASSICISEGVLVPS